MYNKFDNKVWILEWCAHLYTFRQTSPFPGEPPLL